MTLSPQQFSDLIGLVYDSALETDQWHRLLERICEIFPGFMAMTGTFDGGYFVGAYSPSGFVTDSFRTEYRRHWDHGHFIGDQDRYARERLEALRRDPPTLGRVRCSRDWYTDEEYRQSEFSRIFMQPGGAGHWTTLLFALNGPRMAALMFFENEEQRMAKDYRGLRALLELISPHVVRATRLSRALYMAREAAETYKGFLDAIALPLLIVDSGAILQMANTAGQRIIERGDLLSLTEAGRLALDDPVNHDLFQKALRAVVRDNDTRGLRIEREDGLVSLCITPFRPSMSTAFKADTDVFDHHRLFAVFAGTHGVTRINTGLLQDVFQLTRREAEVCSALASGQSPAQIAEASGRAEKTIRNQIQALHEKVGVTSTQELAEALSVFRTVGAMFDSDDPHLFQPSSLLAGADNT